MKFPRPKKSDVPSRRMASVEPRPSTLDSSSQWRRNRTLSGITRSSMDPRNSPRSQVHHLTIRRQKVGGLLLLLLGATVLVGLLISQLTGRVVVSGSSKALLTKIEPAPYEKVINDYFGIHPAERLRFTLSENELSEYTTSILPEVASIKQSGVENVVDTHFTITFRQPIAGWQINGKQYYVDSQGIVFDKNYYAAPTVQIVDESGVSPEQGTTVASARLLSFVGRVVALSQDGGYEVTQAILPSGTTRQIEIRLQNVSTLVKLSIDRGAGEQVEDMIRSLQYLTSKDVTAQYIDVRISGKAAYQ